MIIQEECTVGSQGSAQDALEAEPAAECAFAQGASHPEISIIVPVYHVEATLAQALDSLLGQTFGDFELVLVNDGGTPDETAMCEDYARKDARIVYTRQENQGLSAARNTGLALSRGRWIMFMDTDDWVHESFCEKALESVLSADADIGVFDLMYTDGDTPEGWVHRSELEEGVYPGYYALKERIRGKIQGYVWNKIYRREMWDSIIFPVGELWEDDAVLHEVLDRAQKVAIIHDVLYYKRNRDDSITSLAGKDASWIYWLYVQRRRRWEYLDQHHPELLPVIAQNTATTLLGYGRTCVFRNHDRDAFEEVRQWARQSDLPTQVLRWHTKIRYWAFMHCKPLFMLLERLVPLLKRAGIQPEERR